MHQQALRNLNKQLDDLLRVHHVTISQPREQILQLDDVPVGAAFSQPITNLLLRYDPSRRGRPVDVWHGGKKIHTASVVDAYANCFVRRNRDRNTVETDAQPRAPKPGLRMRDLDKKAGR